MSVKYGNYARTTLAADLSASAAVVSVNETSSFPVVGSGDYFYAVIKRASDNAKEFVKVTDLSGSDYTIERGQGGSVALDFVAGDEFLLEFTAETLDDIVDDISDDIAAVETVANGAETIAQSASNQASQAQSAAAAAQATADEAKTTADNALSKVDTSSQNVAGPVSFNGLVTFNGGIAGSSAVPIGAIAMWMGETPPSGWVECNGQSLSKTDYSDLYEALKNSDEQCMFGQDNASGTFNVPDMRGMFVRGWNHGRNDDNKDPDADDRIDRPDNVGGDHTGTLQADDLKKHRHSITLPKGAAGSGTTSALRSGGTASYDTDYAPTTGGDETRPRNIAVMFIMYAGVTT